MLKSIGTIERKLDFNLERLPVGSIRFYGWVEVLRRLKACGGSKGFLVLLFGSMNFNAH